MGHIWLISAHQKQVIFSEKERTKYSLYEYVSNNKMFQQIVSKIYFKILHEMNNPAASSGESLNSPSLDGRGQGRVKYQTVSSVTPT